MSRSDYSIKDYEHKVNGRVLCKQHGLLRCSECAYVDDLEKENQRYREFLAELKNILREEGMKTNLGEQLSRKTNKFLEESK